MEKFKQTRRRVRLHRTLPALKGVIYPQYSFLQRFEDFFFEQTLPSIHAAGIEGYLDDVKNSLKKDNHLRAKAFIEALKQKLKDYFKV